MAASRTTVTKILVGLAPLVGCDADSDSLAVLKRLAETLGCSVDDAGAVSTATRNDDHQNVQNAVLQQCARDPCWLRCKLQGCNFPAIARPLPPPQEEAEERAKKRSRGGAVRAAAAAVAAAAVAHEAKEEEGGEEEAGEEEEEEEEGGSGSGSEDMPEGEGDVHGGDELEVRSRASTSAAVWPCTTLALVIHVVHLCDA